MTTVVSHHVLRALKIAGVGAALLMIAPASRADPGAFNGYAGQWTGNGTITIANAGTERIRCKGTYIVNNGGNTLQLALRCASDSYRFDLNSDVTAYGENLNGSWTEASRNVNGSVSGRVSAGQVTALVQTNGYAANFSISTRGSKQSVHVTSKGDLRDVTISLTKG
jgi:hypothetical protein